MDKVYSFGKCGIHLGRDTREQAAVLYLLSYFAHIGLDVRRRRFEIYEISGAEGKTRPLRKKLKITQQARLLKLGKERWCLVCTFEDAAELLSCFDGNVKLMSAQSLFKDRVGARSSS